MIVREVTRTRDLWAALALPQRLHAADPAWVPSLRELDLPRIRAFQRRGDLALFAAEQGGRIVGTISALRDEGYVRSKGEKVAWFGFFECEDDPEVARALVDAACEQARRWGAERLRGARNLTRLEHVGITVEGHGTPPPFLQGHHPAYQRRLLEGLGFVKHHDVLAYDTPVIDAQGRRRALPEGLAEKARRCDIPGLVVRPSSRRTLSADLEAAHQVMNAAFVTVPDVSPMPLATFRSLGRTWLTFADPQMLQLAFAGDRPIAFAACFPEVNEALVRARGRLLPFGWARILLGLRRVRTASFKLIGVLPEFRGTGVHARLIEGVIRGVHAAGYQRLEASVIDERNAPMRAVVEHAGMTVYRRYRFFEREV